MIPISDIMKSLLATLLRVHISLYDTITVKKVLILLIAGIKCGPSHCQNQRWQRSVKHYCITWGGHVTQATSQIARFMGPTWGPPGDDRTQVGPMLAPWALLSVISVWRWFSKYAGDVLSYHSLQLDNCCWPNWLTSSGVLWSVH